MPAEITEQELQANIALWIPMSALRVFVWREFPELFMGLPGETSDPAHVVHVLFLRAAGHGVQAQLSARLRFCWPGVFGASLLPASRTGRTWWVATYAAAFLLTSTASAAGMLSRTARASGVAVLPVSAEICDLDDRIEPPPPIVQTALVTAQTTDPQKTETRKPTHSPQKREEPAELHTLEGALSRGLASCGREFGGLDLWVDLSTDDRGIWTKAAVQSPSHALRRCVVPVLDDLRRRAQGRRFRPDKSIVVELHLPPS